MKKKIYLSVIFLLLIVFSLTSIDCFAANKFFWATDIVGTTGTLDAIDGSLLTDGDMAIVGRDNGGIYEFYSYRLENYPSNPPDEAPPDTVAPNTNAESKRWKLLKIYGAPDTSTNNTWTGTNTFTNTVAFQQADATPIMSIPTAPPTTGTSGLPQIASDGTTSWLESSGQCFVSGDSVGDNFECKSIAQLWDVLESTIFPDTITHEQVLCGEVDGTTGHYSAHSCGAKVIDNSTAANYIWKNSDGEIDNLSEISGTVIGGFENSKAVVSDDSGNLTSSKWTFTEPTTAATLTAGGDSKTYTLPADTDTIVGRASSDTLTNKTLDANGTGNVLKGYSYIMISGRAFMRRGSAVTAPSTTQTDFNFGLPALDGADATAEADNWIDFVIDVPPDIDTAVDLTAKLSFYLSGADTGDHDYILSMCNPAASAAADCTAGTPINLAYTADGSGESGNVEYTTETTLTAWKDNVTAGRMWKIRLARDSDDTSNDSSTVDSYPLTLTIKYGYTN